MSDPDIGTLSVRFSVEERRLLEDFARISGVTIEGLIREALFLPPLQARAPRHLRIVSTAESERAEPAPATGTATAPARRAPAASWAGKPGGRGAHSSGAAASRARQAAAQND